MPDVLPTDITKTAAPKDAPSNNPNYNKRAPLNVSLCWSCRHATGAPLDAKSPSYARWACAQLAEYPQTNNNKSYTYAGQEEADKKHIATYQSIPPSKIISPVPEDSLPKVCPWMRNFTPIAGWEATPSKYTNAGSGCGVVESFQVKSCPIYSPDLYAEIESLSNEELAKWLGIPKVIVNRSRVGSQQLLYYYIRNKDYYSAIINNCEPQHLITSALNPSRKENENLYSPLLSIKLPSEIVPMDPEVLQFVLDEVSFQYEEDNADHETRHNLAIINALEFIRTSLGKIALKKKRKEEKEAKAAERAEKRKLHDMKLEKK